MALYHFNVTQASRGKGQSAVACAAYRSGEKLYDDYYGEIQDYTKKGGVLYTEVMLPEYAPERLKDRQTLWNEVEKIEKHPQAQLAFSFNVALQNEFSYEENLELARLFIKDNFLAKGMIVDLAIHNPDKGNNGIPNPHFHVLAPIRPLNKDGLWGEKQHREYLYDEVGNPILDKKGKPKFNAVANTDWGSPETLLEWRENWACLVNAKFEEKGLPQRIDHRSNAERGLDALPTIHEGPTVRAMEKRGIKTNVGDWNRLIKQTNRLISSLKSNLRSLLEWIAVLKVEISDFIETEKLQKADSNALAETLCAYYERRNAGAYSNKAKANNAKKQMEIINFLTENKITTIPELESVIKNMYSKVNDLQMKMKKVEAEKDSIEKIIKAFDDFKAYKPIYDNLRSIKNSSTAEAYNESHHLELTKFYMSRRILKEKYPNGKVPYNTLKSRLEQLENDYSSLFSEYKQVKADASKAYSLRMAIDSDYKQVLKEQNREVKRREDISL